MASPLGCCQDSSKDFCKVFVRNVIAGIAAISLAVSIISFVSYAGVISVNTVGGPLLANDIYLYIGIGAVALAPILGSMAICPPSKCLQIEGGVGA